MKQVEDKIQLPKSKYALDKIREYEAKGYTSSFTMLMGTLTDVTSGVSYGMDDVMTIDDLADDRTSNPDKQSKLYILEMHDGTRGLIHRPYCEKAKEGINLFLTKASLHENVFRRQELV